MDSYQSLSPSSSDPNMVQLRGKYQLPIRLFAQDGRPVTDREGCPLKNIIGKCLCVINFERNIFNDLKGLCLTDALGRTAADINFDPTIIPEYEIGDSDPTQDYECHTVIYDINGHPLTDRYGRPLASRDGQMYIVFGPRGDPIGDHNGRDVINRLGNVITRNKQLKNKEGKQIFLFDCDGKPLTDSESFPLLDITGDKLLLFNENNQPYTTLHGSGFYDAQGISSDQIGCDFTKRPPLMNTNLKVKTDTGEPAVAFNLDGFPLSDLLGNPLCLNNGNCMLSFSHKKWMDCNDQIVTIIPRKIYDKFTLRGFVNSSGLAIRLFDDYGRPLTDINGVPQRHASGKVLIKFDQNGAPISDWLGRWLYDANGFNNSSRNFRPCLSISKPFIIDKVTKCCTAGIQFFDCTGMPLTNFYGYPLVSAKEELMITYNKNGDPLYDFRKKDVFNALGLPVVNSLESPLLGPGGVPIRLYDKEDRPLTDSTGLVLKDVRGRFLLRYDTKDLGITDIKGMEVYDKNGNSTKCTIKFNASGATALSGKQETVISVNGDPMLLFDEDGYPLTEQSGTVLCNRMGKSMIKSQEQAFTTTLDDKPVYDVNGRKCLKTYSKHLGLSVGLYDKNSRPLTDRVGAVLLSRKGQELVLFDKNFRPFSALVGGELYDYKGMPLKHPFADPSYIPKFAAKQVPEGAQLFDCEDLPLTDTEGYILHTSNGIPMICLDIHNRIKCDHSGRPVFDIRGLAVSRTSGAWKDQHGKPYRLYDSLGMPLTDEDGRELYDIEGKLLIRQDDVGRPMHSTKDDYVKDCKGRRFVDIQFKPTSFPTNVKKCLPLLEEDKSPLRVYDVDGNPLTDVVGRPITNSKGDLLLNLKNGIHRLVDSKGRTVFDRFRMPFGCSPKTCIKSMNGQPLLLFDDKGVALTDAEGTPLSRESGNECLICFDVYGRPSTAESGAKLYDQHGRCNLHPQFGQINCNTTTKLNNSVCEPLIVTYDRDGRPLEDSTGQILQ